MVRPPRRVLALLWVALLSMLVTSAVSRRGGLSDEENAYYFDLFAYTAEVCPLESWRRTKDSLLLLYRGDATRAHVEGVYGAIRKDLPVIEVVWRDDRLQVGPLPGPALDLTRALEHFALVELTNLGPQRTFSAAFAGMPESNLASVPPGETYTLLVRGTWSVHPGPMVELTFLADDGAGGTTQDSVAVDVSFAEPVRLTGLVQEDGQPVPGRVWVRGSDNVLRHCWAPHANNTTLTLKNILPSLAGPNQERYEYRVPFCYSGPAGEISMTVPAGTTEIRLERGFEHEIVSTTITADAGDMEHVVLDSSRFVDMQALGWVSGEPHVHWSINDQTEDEAYELLDVVQKAEDVRIVNNLTLRGSKAQAPDFTAPDDFAPGTIWDDGAGRIAYQSEEWRNNGGYGHLNLLNLSELIQPISTGPDLMYELDDQYDWPMNVSAMQAAHNQVNAEPNNGLRGVVLSAHNFDGWFIADLALGFLDGLDQLDPSHYYNILDCGFEVPITMGADHPSRVVGECRTYVQVADPGNPTYGQWIAGLLDERTFVTSGPLLVLRASVGPQTAEIGDSLQVAATDTLHLEVEGWSRSGREHQLRQLQIVSNGVVLLDQQIDSNYGLASIDLPVGASRWVVARTGPAGSSFNALTEAHVAHTSAIYVYADGDRRIFPDDGPAQTYRDLCNSIADAVQAGTKLTLEDQTQRDAAEGYMRAAAQVFEDLLQAYGG